MKISGARGYAVLAVVVIAAAGIIAAVTLQKGDRSGSDAGGDSTGTVETTGVVPAEGSAQATSTADASETPPPTPVMPSYVRYAHVRGLGGTPGNYFVRLDFFDIYTGEAARQQAHAMGVAVPSNGILYVDPDANVEALPLKSDASIVYTTGSVEAPQEKQVTPEQLASWAAGAPDSMPGALTDQWQADVRQGIVWSLKMVVVAD